MKDRKKEDNAKLFNCIEICGISYDYFFFFFNNCSGTSKQSFQVVLNLTEAHLLLLCFVHKCKSNIWIFSGYLQQNTFNAV